MDKDTIWRALQIRYVDLTFRLRILEDTTLPREKCSALRGGMGQMLLEQSCIRDRNCEACDFQKECLVNRILYSQYEIQPKFASRGDSIGYVMECNDHREYFYSGDMLEFHLLLYGKTIVYFTQILQAFFMLGQVGLGKKKAKYDILSVKNEQGDLVADDHCIFLQNLGIRTIAEYVKGRQETFKSLKSRKDNEIEDEDRKYILKFQTPTTIKYQGKFLQQFHGEAIVRSVIRRIYSFDCFEGIDIPLMEAEEVLRIKYQKVKYAAVTRYSSRAKSKMDLKGIYGEVILENISDEMIILLLAAERLHIGKNSSFGFGKYMLQSMD